MNAKLVRYGIPALALALGLTLGAATHPAAAPEVKTVTQTVTKPVTPNICITALGRAERVMGDASEGIALMSEYIGNLDAASINSASSRVAELSATAKSDRADYDNAATQCKAAQ